MFYTLIQRENVDGNGALARLETSHICFLAPNAFVKRLYFAKRRKEIVCKMVISGTR